MQVVLIILLCNPLLQNQQLKTTNTYYLTVSRGQDSLGLSWLRVFHEVATKMSARAASVIWDWGICFQTHSHSYWPEASILLHLDLSIGLLMTLPLPE